MRSFLALLALFAGLMLLFGCAGNASPQQPGAQPAGNSVQNATAPPAGTAPPSAENGKSGDNAEFQAMLQKSLNSEWKAYYDYTVYWADEKGKIVPMPGNVSIYFKPEKSRTDTHIGHASRARSYIGVSELEVYCVENVLDGKWRCIDGRKMENRPEFLGRDYLNNSSNYKAVKDGPMRIAGADTACYMLYIPDPDSGKKTDYKSRLCFTAEGIPLYSNVVWTRFPEQFTRHAAVSFSSDVSESYFALPAPVTARPGK